MDRSAKATAAALLGNSIFGFSFLFSSVALKVASPFVLLSARFLLAFLTLNLLLLTGKQKLDLKGKPIKKLLLLGLTQPVLYFIFENYGIAMTTSSFSGVMLGLMPVMGLILGRVMLGERPTALQTVCAFGSIFGVALTTVGGGVGAVAPLGFLVLVGAVVSAALFNVISRDTSKDFTAFERTYVMFALGSVVFTAIALLQSIGDPASLTVPLTTWQFWGPVVYLAVASSVCAFLLINYALTEISVAKSTICSNFATVISVLAGIFIMGDSFTAVQLIGVVIIIVSVFGVSYKKSEKQKVKS